MVFEVRTVVIFSVYGYRYMLIGVVALTQTICYFGQFAFNLMDHKGK